MSLEQSLPPGQQLAAPGKWPLVGERAPKDVPPIWSVEVAGLVAMPQQWTLGELKRLPTESRAIDVHCVTRWSKPGMYFCGVPLALLLQMCQPLPQAEFVSFIAHSDRRHSTSLSLNDCYRQSVLVAWEAEGRPLPIEHGGPVRTITPGRYFYKSLKWLKRIELTAADQLGYWESTAGYHNEADPWRQQRYLASTLDKRDAARLIAARDFRGRDLRGIQAAGYELKNLQAAGALLRDADFRGANLQQANFSAANLSNAHCQRADLRGASLQQADLEGANFEGADLRAANLSGASLFGATFLGPTGDAALIDDTTIIDPAAFDQLTPEQAESVRTGRRPNG